MPRVVSRDGTEIVYEREGRGDAPPVVLVDGAFCHRRFGPMADLAPHLAPHFTAFFYDRRGRGESGDTAPWSLDKEIDDLEALIDVAGGKAHVYGTSSGAVLALRAAARGAKIDRLALYEPPLVLDASRPPMPDDYAPRIETAVREGRGGDAVKIFMKEGVLVPGFGVFMMRLLPAWSKLVAAAGSIPREIAILGDTRRGAPLPADLVEAAGRVAVPTLVMGGAKSPPWLRHAVEEVARRIPGAAVEMLPGQTHQVSPKALAPRLTAFFGSA